MKRRLTATFLCLCLLFTLLPAAALAEGETDGVPSPAESALCEHHPRHDESCGYTEGSAGTPCAHAHSGDCYAPVTSCVHTHTADCFPAAPADGAGNAPEDPAAPAEAAACTHVCSAESGCVTNVLDCHHTHDAACGYVPAVEGTPCGYVCEICRSQEGGEAEETAPEETGPEPTEPEETGPEPTEPEETGPEPTEPEETDPEPTEPEETAPEETDSEPTEPEETVPTDPEPTEPEPEPEENAPDPEAVCLCAQRCTENSVNADCPVCSAGGADLSACLGAVPAAALAAAAARASGHTNHPLCGAACDGDCGGSHGGLTWQPLSVSSGNRELSSGNYYLEEDLQIDFMLIIDANATVNLCLNGHVLEYTGSDLGVSVIKIGSEAASTSILNVCDCSAGAEHRFTVEDNGLWKLDGNGAQSLSGGVITGGENGGIYLHVSGVVLNLYGGNIAGNHGCGIRGYGGVNLYGGSVTGNVSDREGGGIRALRVHIYGGSVANNRASSGGGVYVSIGNSFTMEGGTISGNTAAGSGGGVYVAEKNDVASLPGGTFTMKDGTISGNEAQYIGGGVYVGSGGTFTMEGGSITDNNARTTSDGAAGGGVSVAGGSFTMEKGVIRSNGADNGGGVGLGGNGSFTMNGGEISENHASTAGGHKNHGGGVCILSGIFTMTGGKIINNRAPYGYGGGIALKNQGGGTMTATVSISGNSQITGNTQASGGGVHMLSGGKLELSGTPQITNNTTSGREVNLYFPSGITDTSITLGPLEAGAEIGITNDSGDDIPIIDETGSAPSFAQFFQSDAGGFHVIISKGELVLEPDFYNVVFHRNLGSDTMEWQQFYCNQPQALQANPFGLQALFRGWNTKRDGTGTAYHDQAKVCNLTTEHGAEVHLYAQWDLGPYTVTLDPNGGTIAEGKDITSYAYSESPELPAGNEITRAGYTFQGWKDDASGSIVTKISSSDYGAKTFIAQWEPITYIVAFDANGGEGSMSNQTFTYDVEQTLTASGFTQTGHDFAGWSTTEGGAVVYADQQEVSNLTATGGETVTLYAQWKPSTYAVVLAPNEGTIANGKNVTSYTYGTGAALPTAEDITRTGYQFEGWYEDSSFSDSPVTEITAAEMGNKTYYAKWVKVWTVTVTAEGGGTVSGGGTYEDGSTVTVTATPNGGLRFAGWTENGVQVSTSTSYAFTLTGDRSLTAEFARSSNSSGASIATYPVIVADTEHGAVTVSHREASRNTPITITVTPDAGYELDSLTVTEAGGGAIEVRGLSGGKYTFAMPSGRVTVKAVFAEIAPEALPFLDVPEGYWAYDAIQYVYGEGLMAGTSGSTFSPEGTTTRGQIVTILWRLSGSPVVNYLMDFDDVDPAAYYAEAIRWATSEGIAGGYGGGLFGPDDPITREQLAVMLHRYAKHEGYDVSIGEDTNILSYADAFTVSEYAVSALQWACGAGIISGTGDGSTLTPQGEATRAQAATVLMRFCEQSTQ